MFNADGEYRHNVLITFYDGKNAMGIKEFSDYFSAYEVRVIALDLDRYLMPDNGTFIEKEAKIHEKIRRTIGWNNPIEYYLERMDTYDYDVLVKYLYRMIRMRTNDGHMVIVDIGRGTKEYIAAASLVTMMFKNTILARTVLRKEDRFGWNLSTMVNIVSKREDNFKIGIEILDHIEVSAPNELNLKRLKVFNSIPLNDRSSTNVIKKMILKGVWKNYDAEKNDEKLEYGTSLEYEMAQDFDNKRKYKEMQNKERVRYQRSFIGRWLEEGLIQKEDRARNKYVVTEKGERYLDLFCNDKIFNIDGTNIWD